MFSRYRYIEGLTSLLGSNGKYLINYLGGIRDELGREVPTSLDTDGHITVDVLAWNGLGTYRVIDLVAIQYKDLKIPASEYGKVKAFVMDRDKTNVQCKNVGYRFEGGPIEVESAPGFYYVPAFTRYAINREGVLINAETRKAVKPSVSPPYPKFNIKGGYVNYPVVAPSLRSTSVGRHRALALTFFDYPDNVDKLVVNHKDGVPGNDSLDNLEWVTRGQNNFHAYINDLKGQHKRVIVKNVRTGEETEYYSMAEAARQLGFPTHETIGFRLRSTFGKVFEDGTQVKYKDDERAFPEVPDPEKAIAEAQISTPVKVRDCKTLSEGSYGSATKAGRDLDVSPATILYRLHKDDRSPLRGYQFARADDKRPWPSFTKEEYLATLNPSAMRVDARNVLTGDVMVFPSIAKARGYFGGAIAATLRSGRQYLNEYGWQFKLEDDVFEEVDNPEETCYNLRREVMAKHVETEKVIIADSCRTMGAIIGCCPKSIKAAALTRGKKIFRNHRFKLGRDEPWPE